MRKSVVPLTVGLLLAVTGHGLHAHGVMSHDATDKPVIKEQTAWGIAGDPENVTRTLEVVMTDDMRFTPSGVTIVEGETIRLVIRNAGAIMHELVIGDEPSLQEHADLMLEFPEMEHDEPYMAHVAPGETAEIIWHFNRAGKFEFACLLPGHYQAGMLAKVGVEPSRVTIRDGARPSGHGSQEHP
jgi:uncharacterized cupredoxin-like copper-binding protein